MDPHIWPSKSRTTSSNLHTAAIVKIQDVILKTCRKRGMIGRSGERWSGISVLAARHDDDDEVNLKEWHNECPNVPLLELRKANFQFVFTNYRGRIKQKITKMGDNAWRTRYLVSAKLFLKPYHFKGSKEIMFANITDIFINQSVASVTYVTEHLSHIGLDKSDPIVGRKGQKYWTGKSDGKGLLLKTEALDAIPDIFGPSTRQKVSPLWKACFTFLRQQMIQSGNLIYENLGEVNFPQMGGRTDWFSVEDDIASRREFSCDWSITENCSFCSYYWLKNSLTEKENVRFLTE